VKKIIFVLFGLSLIACDDGDILVTEFEFDDAPIELCSGAKENEFVVFKTNRANNEAISFRFFTDSFSTTQVTKKAILIPVDSLTNILVYRQFNIPVDNNYFCGTVPPGNIFVTEEIISIKGTAEIKVSIFKEDDNDGVDPIEESGGIDPTADPDEDDVPNFLDDDSSDPNVGNENMMIENGFDQDKDGIPNFLDQDDDNDNILTSAEFPDDDPTTDNPKQSDDDGIPDYLDSDDDGDGIETKDEDTNMNGNPRDDLNPEGVANYLNPDVSIRTPNSASLDNTIITTFRTTIIINDLIFNQQNNSFMENTFSFGAKDEIRSIINGK